MRTFSHYGNRFAGLPLKWRAWLPHIFQWGNMNPVRAEKSLPWPRLEAREFLLLWRVKIGSFPIHIFWIGYPTTRRWCPMEDEILSTTVVAASTKHFCLKANSDLLNLSEAVPEVWLHQTLYVSFGRIITKVW